MPYFNQSQVFNTDPAILAFSKGNIAPISASVTNAFVGFNADNRLTVQPGLFIADTGSAIRFLPRAKVTNAVATTANNFTMTPYNIFVPGDILYVLEAYTVLTITASNAGQTQTVTISGKSVTATVSSATTSQSAIEIASAINNDPYVSGFVNAIALNSTVYIFGKDQKTLIPVAISGTVTSSLSNANTVFNTTPIGTIASIANLTGTVTLTANSSVALPVGTNIGVPVKKILGLHVHSIDFGIASQHDCNCYTSSSGVRIQYLPYFDHSLRLLFPKMEFDYVF